jgi:hypothetical protein
VGLEGQPLEGALTDMVRPEVTPTRVVSRTLRLRMHGYRVFVLCDTSVNAA